MKYIDADKLIAEIERRTDLICTTEGVVQRDKLQEYEALRDIEDFIFSLQKEQPEFPTTDEEVEKALSTIPIAELPDKYKTPDWIWEDKTIDQLAEEYVEGVKKCNDTPTWDLIHTAVCYGYELGRNARKEQEQPEVDFEKEAVKVVLSKEHIEGKESLVLLTARHFFELGLKARKEE